MAFHSFYKDLEKQALAEFPGLSEVPEITWDHLISPITIRLPKSIQKQATDAISSLFSVSRLPKYESLLQQDPQLNHGGRQHHSVLMAYDFHTSEFGDCKLVEINTNASGYLLSALMESNHRKIPLKNLEALKSLKNSFVNELTMAGKSADRPHVLIIDEDVLQQKMWLEFVMYKNLFETWGWTAAICDSKELKIENGRLAGPDGQAADLIYNRTTDFYLENPAHEALRKGFLDGLAVISPNPREYFLLADKQRLIQFTQDQFLESVGATKEAIAAIQRVLIPTYEKSHFESEDEIWSQKRNLFFKPKRSFGGKSVYRGESVSRKVFERLMAEDILIQKFQPAQKVPTDDPRSVVAHWKFDLRFYVYEDKIQTVAARIYQGQVTNFHSEMGGFTLVEFSD